MWIDYVKVMDNVAEELMGTNPRIRNTIKREMNDILNYPDFNDTLLKGFYTEEIGYNNLRCIKYVQDFIQAESGYNPDCKLICLINPISYQYNLKTKRNSDYSDYLNIGNPNALMLAWYPLEAWGNPPPVLPNTIIEPYYFAQGTHDSIVEQITEYTNSLRVNYATYTSYIQYKWDKYDTLLSLMQSKCIESGKEFHIVPQIHNLKCFDPPTGQGLREPLNSEIGVLFCQSLCYGVKGILPFAFESFYFRDKQHYQFGMMDYPSFSGWGWMRDVRVKNFYNEPKWDYVKDLYAKIKIWGPVLANSTNTSGFSVSAEGANHFYIDGILSVDPRINAQNETCVNDAPSYVWADCPDETYWEMGFFSSSDLNTKYFMMVNRRCVPIHGDNEGDIRALRINFDANELQGSNNWTISDFADPRRAVIFDKNAAGYVDLYKEGNQLGYFLPGEGKLFKLEPTVKSGGTLVADEYIPAGGEFFCTDTVWTNGYDLTIENNVDNSFFRFG